MKGFGWLRGIRAAAVLCLLPLAGCADPGPNAYWAPDSRSVALDVDGRLRLFDLGSGRLRTLDSDGRHVVNPAPSPGGRQVAYYGIVLAPGGSASCDLWLKDVETGRERRIARAVTRIPDSGHQNPRGSLVWGLKIAAPLAWHPEGRRLAYLAEESGHLVLRVVDVTSGRTRSLVHAGREQYAPSWSPDGRRIAYLALDPRGTSLPGLAPEVWLAAADGSERRCLAVRDPRAFLWASRTGLSWSADGTSIAALVARGDGAGARIELQRIPVTGGGVTTLARLATPEVSLSAGHEALVYLGGKRKDLLVYKIPPSGAPRILDRILHTPGGRGDEPGQSPVNAYPVLSPDGTMVAHLVQRDDEGFPVELRLYEPAIGRKSVYSLPDGRLIEGDPVRLRPHSGPANLLRAHWPLRAWLGLGAALTLLAIALRLTARAFAMRGARP